MGHVIGFDTTYTGNPVSFNAAHGGTMKSIVAPLTYTQDLHGYANPWPAGGGVNIMPTSAAATKTNNGVTIATTGNGVYTFSGTALTITTIVFDLEASLVIPVSVNQGGNGAFFLFNTSALANGNGIVLFNGGTTVDTWGFNVENKSSYGYSAMGGKTINKIGFTIIGGTNVDGFSCSPMFKNDGSTSASAFIPYSNICPISGLTGLSVYVSPTQDPDDATVYNVDWTTQAGTVYGGTVDVVTGVLTVDKVAVKINGSTVKAAGITSYGTLNRFAIAYGNNMPTANYSGSSSFCLSDKMTPSYTNTVGITTTSPEGYYCFQHSSAFFVSMPSSTITSVAQANSWFAANTPMVCYELATPVTYQLTPKQITALIGQNYIWSSNNQTLTAVLTAPATGFAGWLIKCVTNGTPVEIPLKYMRAETYTVTPDQRMEWSAERDVTGVLHRETVQNLPPKIEFNTPLMTNSDINALNSIIKAAFTSYLQRNITIQFYDPERNQYWEWDCYMPDVKYHIRNADTVNNIINYEELRYAFIGY